jgi:hypothetical protein
MSSAQQPSTDQKSSPRSAPASPAVTPRHWAISLGLAVVICVVAIAIGEHSIEIGPAAVVLFPIIWAVLIGSVVGLQRIKPVSGAVRAAGDPQVRVGIVMFLALLGLGIGPSLSKISSMGPAMLLQEVGHIFGTVIIALPVAVGLGMGRSAIGAAWSVDRESFLAYAIERFGPRSPEYRGVFGVWIFGAIFGALYISLVSSVMGSLDILHPLALAMGLGLGSSSMMLGGVGALSILYPDQAAEIMAVAALSNLITNIVGFYAGVFLALPVARKLYLIWCRVWRRPEAEVLEAREVARGRVPEGDASLGRSRPQQETGILTAAIRVPADPPEPRGWKVVLFVYLTAGFLGLLLNYLGTGAFRPQQVLGTLALMVLTGIAGGLARLVPAIPASVWVLAIATLVSAPFSPLAPVLLDWVDGLDVMLFGLLQLALIGLSLGRDVEAIKKLSWKVVVIALITLTSSFLAAAVLAQTVLHL